MTRTRDFDPDTLLMIRVQQNDSESFASLLSRNRNLVIKWLWRMVLNEAIASDLAQDVFVRVYRARASYEPTAKFSTWLFRITMNVGRNYIRDEKRHRDNIRLNAFGGVSGCRGAADRALLVEERLLRDEAAAQIFRAVLSLPAKQRAAVMMHKYEEMDYGQIAGVLGCSRPAVKALMFRAHEALRFRLRNFGACRESPKTVRCN